jgi:NAD(P)-dependent dehydrogenase (short-subunit alcohol dehydrogenase family)
MLLKLLSGSVLAVAVFIGVFAAGVPTQVGLWRWAASRNGQLIGMAPAFMHDDEYKKSFDDIRALDLSGQTAIVTGANIGLGYWTALHLARQGAHVILACRSPDKCANAAAQISRNHTSASVETATLDTSSLQSVQAFAEGILQTHKSLDMLVLNAGIGKQPTTKLTKDGIEMTFATNHVGHFHLYKRLLPILEGGGKTGAARVVLVSSAAHYDTFPFGVATTREALNSIQPDMKVSAAMLVLPRCRAATLPANAASLPLPRSQTRALQCQPDADSHSAVLRARAAPRYDVHRPCSAYVQMPHQVYGMSKLAQVLFAQEATKRLPPDSKIYINACHRTRARGPAARALPRAPAAAFCSRSTTRNAPPPVCAPPPHRARQPAPSTPTSGSGSSSRMATACSSSWQGWWSSRCARTSYGARRTAPSRRSSSRLRATRS